MLVSGGYEGGFVGPDKQFRLAIRHLGDAADHHPVLTAMMMQLEAEATPRPYLDALDLEARSFLQHGVSSPGPADGPMQLVERMIALLQELHDLLDLLNLVGAGDQQGIRRVDDHQVIEAHRRH